MDLAGANLSLFVVNQLCSVEVGLEEVCSCVCILVCTCECFVICVGSYVYLGSGVWVGHAYIG